MGYRAEWLSATRVYGSRHLEPVLYAFDKEVNIQERVSLLDVGVENGGSLETWLACLPHGSTVSGLDIDPATTNLEYEVLVCDVTDKAQVRQVLKGRWFDIIVDDSRAAASHNLWPFLRAGGLMFIEGVQVDQALPLMHTVIGGYQDCWLPYEEILRIAFYPGVAVIEKRVPRSHDYLEIMTGTEFGVVSQKILMDQGVKQVVL